jgi:hypothetical protein
VSSVINYGVFKGYIKDEKEFIRFTQQENIQDRYSHEEIEKLIKRLKIQLYSLSETGY